MLKLLFVLGLQAEQNPDLILEMQRDGHLAWYMKPQLMQL